MKVGIALNMLSEPPRPDVAVVSDHLAMGDLAEPLGFDSLFALEHHFTGYAMSPAPTQLLSYFAGRTRRPPHIRQTVLARTLTTGISGPNRPIRSNTSSCARCAHLRHSKANVPRSRTCRSVHLSTSRSRRLMSM